MKAFSIRLGNHFSKFRKENKFTDCILRSNDVEIPCQRLILAQHSEWFAQYFTSHPPKSLAEPVIVDVPVNPDGILQQFIDLIYDNYAIITIQNLPPLLKMTSYYKCDNLTRILTHFYKEAESDENILFFAEKFTELELFEESTMLAPRLAYHLKNIHNNVEPLAFTLPELFKSLSAQVFAAVLSEETLRVADQPEEKIGQKSSTKKAKLRQPLTDDDIVSYIEQYVRSNPSKIKTEQDKEALSKTIDWNSVVAYQYLTRFSCDWVPSRIARPLIIKILNNRRKLLTSFTKNTKKTADSVSHWYVYSWAQYCRDAKVVRDDKPEIEVIQFIRTLGGAAAPLNPDKYGLISLHSFGKQMSGFGAAKAFLSDPHQYFMADIKGSVQDKTAEMPGFAVNFGPETRFHAKNLTIDSFANPKYYFISRQPQPKATIKSVYFSTGADITDCKNSQNQMKIQFPNTPFPPPENFPNPGLLKDYTLANVKPFDSLMVRLAEPVTNGSYMMRVTSFEMRGSFECQ